MPKLSDITKRSSLPVDYNGLTADMRRRVRNQYILEQEGKCFHCGRPLCDPPPERIMTKRIDWKLFPRGFLKNPVHLQHNHETGMTEGAVHARCNAVLWQYHGR